MKLNITDLSKPLLLLAFYNAAKNQGPIYANNSAARLVGLRMKDGSLKRAEELFEQRGYDAGSWSFDTIDLGGGPRPLKVNLGKWEPDFSNYELHHGTGLAERVIKSCRQETIKKLRAPMTDGFMENGQEQEKNRFEKFYTLLENKKASQTFFNEEEQSTPKKIDFGMPRIFSSKL